MTQRGSRAGRWLAGTSLLTLSLAGLSGAANSPAARAPQQHASEARMKKDIFFLASPLCEGRGPTTRGLNVAADYIAAEFKKIGLAPGYKGGYFQPFTIPGSQATLALDGPSNQSINLIQGSQFSPLGVGQQGKVSAPLVFAGFGITCKDPAYDDYAGLDVKGKVVVALRDTPRGDQKRTREMQLAGSLSAKLALARKNGAAALFVVNDLEAASEGDTPIDFSYSRVARGGAPLPAALVRRDVVEKLLPAGKTLTGIEKQINKALQPERFEIEAWQARLEVKRNDTAVQLKNVIGVLEGSGPLASQTVIVGAHYDHLGYGGTSSLAGTKKRLIHFGADDNGSGTTATLELARRFAALPNRQGRRLVFMAFSGEELGLLGSRHYCDKPAFPLAETAAMFNLDMVGRLKADPQTGLERILSEGHGTAREFKPMIERATREAGLALSPKESGFGPSDHASFCAKKIPVLFVWTGVHPDYHRPTDTPDKINLVGMRRIVDMAEKMIATLTRIDRPAFVEVKGASGGRMTGGPRLGIRPGYGEEGQGVKVDGVGTGGPAERGGVLDGDVIVAIAGKPVKDLKTYMQAMSLVKAGTTIDVTVQRASKKLTLKVKLD